MPLRSLCVILLVLNSPRPASAHLRGELEPLIEQALAEPPSKETTEAQAKLKRVVAAVSDRDECGTLLASRLENGTPAGKKYLLGLLGSLEGKIALKAVVASALSDDLAAKDAAIHVLAGWRTSDAAPALLRVAQHEDDPKYQERALRGYIEIARVVELSDRSRLDMFETAMRNARRDVERRLAVGILGRCSTLKALESALSCVQEPALKNAAINAIVEITARLVPDDPVVAKVRTEQDASKVADDVVARAKRLLKERGAGVSSPAERNAHAH